MFTGIIEEIGELKGIVKGSASSKLTIQGHRILTDIKLGDSIAVNGVCLTVVHFGKDYFVADVMHETINRTTLSRLTCGSKVNLERAMPADGRFGGHIVAGHIDCTGTIIEIRKDDNAIWYQIKEKEENYKYIVEKGSISIDGISLTAAKVSKDAFYVSVIPHTASHTILGYRKVGDEVNIEHDMVAKYVESLLFGNSVMQAPIKGDSNTSLYNKQKNLHDQSKQTTITEEFLRKYGY